MAQQNNRRGQQQGQQGQQGQKNAGQQDQHSQRSQGRGGQMSSRSQGGQSGSQSGADQSQGQNQGQGQNQDIQTKVLNAVTPALQEVRTYVEGSPVRAAAIGAIAGGLLMTLFSTEKGRTFARAAYDYANPMVAKYAREYISKAAGDMAESAIAH